MASSTLSAARQGSRLISSSVRIAQPKGTTFRSVISTSTSTSISTCSKPSQSRPQTKSLSSQCLYRQSQRSLSSSSTRRYPIDGGGKTTNRTGVRMAVRATVFLVTGLGLIAYFQYEKARLERKRIVEMSKGYGKPKVGGPFVLRDLDGKEFTEKDLLGKYAIIYFGFTHCPDICPDELDKLSAAIDILQSNKTSQNTFRPLFMSVDPARDTPAVLKSYLAEFHPQIMGLTGTWQQIKDTCKAYRVYFSTPQDLKPGEEDYLVDHSIYFYVMDPEGDFVECIGRQDTPESAAGIILEHIKDWRKDGKSIDQTPLTYRNDIVKQTQQRRSSEIGPITNKVNAPA